jgi:hypothetical protein
MELLPSRFFFVVGFGIEFGVGILASWYETMMMVACSANFFSLRISCGFV